MKELKDLLKPPFTAVGKTVKNAALWEQFRVECFEREENWKFAEFIAQALNSEWQRRFGGDRWVYKGSFIVCPKCNSGGMYSGTVKRFTNYCPHCGVKLLPPEANNDQR